MSDATRVGGSGARPEVVVVGGGLAGLAAAIACVDGGASVTVLEGRPRLGGATWSFERNGLSFDNGQHVYLRCCIAYQRFLERIGTAHLAPIDGALDLPVLAPSAAPGGEPECFQLRSRRLPAPLHLGPSLLAFGYLSRAERVRLGRAALAIARLRLNDPSLDDETFGSFLARHGQSPNAIASFWDLVGLPTTNVRAGEVSLALAAKVFKTLLSDASAGDIGWARVPLAKLHAEPAAQLLERSGAVIHRRTKVLAIEIDAGRVSGVATASRTFPADAVILAVPHDDAAGLLPDASGVETSALAGLGFSPIIDVHIVYDRVVSDHRLAAGLRSPVQYVFDRTDAAGLDPREGQCLAVSISGADDEHGLRPEVLIDRYVSALAELFPKARAARVLDAVVSREHEATFRGVPGTAALRARTATRVANLFLSGAWTDTGWPATMEGAVRSGTAAAARALYAIGHERSAEQIGEGVPA